MISAIPFNMMENFHLFCVPRKNTSRFRFFFCLDCVPFQLISCQRVEQRKEVKKRRQNDEREKKIQKVATMRHIVCVLNDRPPFSCISVSLFLIGRIMYTIFRLNVKLDYSTSRNAECISHYHCMREQKIESSTYAAS